MVDLEKIMNFTVGDNDVKQFAVNMKYSVLEKDSAEYEHWKITNRITRKDNGYKIITYALRSNSPFEKYYFTNEIYLNEYNSQKLELEEIEADMTLMDDELVGILQKRLTQIRSKIKADKIANICHEKDL